jgi:murein DD-endopeptidase MepM/ murein hydrolase activator NlpD
MLVMSRVRRVVAGALGAALFLGALAGSGGPAAAEPGSRDRRAELRDLIGEASRAEADALAELLDVQERRVALAASARALDEQVAASTAELARVEDELDLVIAARLSVDDELARQRARLERARRTFQGTAAALYKTSGGPSGAFTALLFDADDPSQLASGTQYLEEVSVARREDVDELVGVRERLERLARDADARQAEAISARARVASERDRLAALRTQREEHNQELARELAREQDIVDSIRARKDEFVAELAALESSSSSITTMLAQRQRNQVKAESFHVVRPVPGAISSGFGPRVHPILGGTRMHNGVDMSASHGSPIKAGAAGVVVWAGPRSGYGNTVIIDHGNRYATLYAHASALVVSSGDRVRAGQVVARVGATGLATAPHLHFEVRLLGIPQNPVRFF